MPIAMINTAADRTLQGPAPAPTRRLRPVMLLWLLILTSMAQFRVREGSELFGGEGMDAQVKFQILTWGALGCFCVWLIFSGRTQLSLLRGGPLFWFAGYAFVAFFSLWVSPVPALTGFRAAQLGIGLILVLSLSAAHLRRMNAFILAYLLINWLLLALALTGLDFGQEWIYSYTRDRQFLGGDFMQRWRFESAYAQASWLSIVAAVGAISVAAKTPREQWLRNAPLFAFFVLTALLTVSRTAILGLALGLGAVAFMRQALPFWLCIFVLPLALLFVAPEVREKAGAFLSRGQNARELASLTGRTALYDVAAKRIDRSMPWGEGFQSGRYAPLEEDKASMAHAHNLLLEATMSAGLLGGFTVAMALLTWTANLIWLWRRDGHPPSAETIELCAVSLPLLAFCFLDSGFSNSLHHVTFLYIFAWARTQLAVNATAASGAPATIAAPAATVALSPAAIAALPSRPLRTIVIRSEAPSHG